MIYAFDDFELNATRVELTRGGAAIALEPQVYALLLLLVEQRDRLVTKDEIVEKVWDGRIVSDAAISSRIKSARKALDDDGARQRAIKTVHGRGFRFVAPVRCAAAAAPVAEAEAAPDAASETELAVDAAGERPSIAVLPFERLDAGEEGGAVADAIPHELIVALSRLRWLFVIARGSSFRFRASESGVEEIGRALGARYVLSGAVEMVGPSMAVTAELADARDGGVVWADRFSGPRDAVHELRERISAQAISALEIQIPLNEARLASPENLDAWSAYHLGLRCMFRFNRSDNAAAAALFQSAIEKEPGFARAHAGLSFTHFQTAFMRYGSDAEEAAARARGAAEEAASLDPLDPFANFNLGRSFWLSGELEAGAEWLERATALSPSYAHGLYARAWTGAMAGRGAEALRLADEAMRLSPLDPFRYGMLGSRALALMGEGDAAAAATAGDQAARTPGAHFLIGMIATAAHGLAGDGEKAAAWADRVRARRPDATREHFFRAFPYADAGTRERVSAALAAQRF